MTLGGTIEVGVDFAVLNKFIVFDHILELVFGHEEVVFPVLLTFSRVPGGVRHTESEPVGELFLQGTNKSSFAGSRGTHYNKTLVPFSVGVNSFVRILKGVSGGDL